MVNFGDFKYLNDGQVWVCLKCRGQNLTRYVLWVNVRWVVNPQNVCVCEGRSWACSAIEAVPNVSVIILSIYIAFSYAQKPSHMLLCFLPFLPYRAVVSTIVPFA